MTRGVVRVGALLVAALLLLLQLPSAHTFHYNKQHRESFNSSLASQRRTVLKKLNSGDRSATMDSSAAAIKIAIIGAGAAGCATTRIFMREFQKLKNQRFEVSIFEKSGQIGGVWNYRNTNKYSNNNNSKNKICLNDYESNELEINPMYSNLRTNLPREIMAFKELQWGKRYITHTSSSSSSEVVFQSKLYSTNNTDNDTAPSYITHQEVQEYLEYYCDSFKLFQNIRANNNSENNNNVVTSWNLNTKVTHLQRLMNDEDEDESADNEWSRFRLQYETTTEEESSSSSRKKRVVESQNEFDIVCVCNGHYALPAKSWLKGLEYFKISGHGKQQRERVILHAVQYDEPSAFEGKTVLCIGGRASGADLAREVSAHAEKVLLSDSTFEPLLSASQQFDQLGNVFLVPRAQYIDETGTVHFGLDGDDIRYSSSDIDVIIMCIGYDYHFDFIDEKSNIGNDWKCQRGERRVAPLYEQLWHARYPSLAFIGLPHSVIPFPLFELQAQAIASNVPLLASIKLPDRNQRLKAANMDAEAGGPKKKKRVQDTHYLGSFQWDYWRRLAKLAGIYNDDFERYTRTTQKIYDDAGAERGGAFPGGPDSYRSRCYTRDEAMETFTSFMRLVAHKKEHPSLP